MLEWAQSLSRSLITNPVNSPLLLLSLGTTVKSAVEEYEQAMAKSIAAAKKYASEKQPVNSSDTDDSLHKDVDMSNEATAASSSSGAPALSTSESGSFPELETVIVLDDARGRLVSTLHEIINLAIHLHSDEDSVAPLSPQAFLALLGSSCASISHSLTPSSSAVLVDVLWVASFEIDKDNTSNVMLTSSSSSSSSSTSAASMKEAAGSSLNSDFKRLGNLVRAVCDKGLVSRSLILERMELDLVDSSGLGKLETMKSKLVKTNTRLLYTQLKYNLFAEEGEGYAKLLELLLHSSETASGQDLSVSVQALVGRFSLDPNRVFDIILDAYELRTASRRRLSLGLHSADFDNKDLDSNFAVQVPDRSFLSLLDGNLFSRSNLGQLLGFKFSHFAHSSVGIAGLNPSGESVVDVSGDGPIGSIASLQAPGTTTEADATQTTQILPSAPQSLYTLAAWLIATNCVNLREIWAHLGPSPSQCLTLAELISRAVKDEQNASFSGSSSISAGVGPVTAQAGSPDVGAALPTNSSSIGTAELGSHPACAIALDVERVHQKAGLVAGLIRVGSWAWAAQALSLLRTESSTGTFALESNDLLPLEIALKEAESDNNKRTNFQLPLSVMLSPASPKGLIMGCGDVCYFPSIAKAVCSLTRAVTNAKMICPQRCVSALLSAAVPTCPPHLDPIMHYVPFQLSSNLSSSSTSLLVNTVSAGHLDKPSNNKKISSFLVRATSLSELFPVLEPLLNFAGPHISCDPGLLMDLLRCIRVGLSDFKPTKWPLDDNDPAAPTLTHLQLLDLLKTYVFPALTLSGSNTTLSQEMWEILKLLPWPLRFEIYTYLKDIVPNTHPAFQYAKARALAGARQAMKRVAQETLRQSGRMIAKVAQSNPCVAIDVIVTTLETYDNLIPLATEALKYVGPLALDVTAFILVDKLYIPRRRTKGDGMTPSDWLQSLANFVGQFYRKYHHVEIGALLYSLVCSLTGLGVSPDENDDAFVKQGKKGSAAAIERLIGDLPVLSLFRQLITRMCGLEALPDMTDEQLESCGGSEALRNQFLSRTLVVGPAPWMAGTAAARTAPKINEALERILQLNSFERAIARLRDTLLHGYGGGPVAMPLLVLLAQQHDFVVFGSPKGPLTVPPGFDINNDEQVEAWPLDFGPPSEPPPPLKVVGSQYDGIHATTLLYADLLRVHALPTSTTYSSMCPSIQELLTVFRLTPALSWLIVRPAIRCATYPGLVDGTADINSLSLHLLEANVAAASLAKRKGEAEFGEFQVKMKESASAILGSLNQSLSIFNETFHRQIEAAIYSSPTDIEHIASSSLPFSGPWVEAHVTPELYSFFWAHSLYDICVPIAGYEKAAVALNEAYTALDASATNPAMLSSTDLRTNVDRERIRTRYLDTIKKLKAERPAQEVHVKRVISGLDSLKDLFFLPNSDKKGALGAMMQHMILPRSLQSPEDALYSARFLLLLHEVGTPAFIVPTVFEKLVSQVAPHLLACTEIEAGCLGVLFAEVLKTVMKWKDSPNSYSKEAASRVTFSTSYSDPSASRLTRKEFVVLLDTVFVKLQRLATAALASQEYMEIKNALVFLMKISAFYPYDKPTGLSLMALTSKLREDEGKPDVKAMAVSYYSRLDKKFNKSNPPPQPQLASSSSGSAGGTTHSAAAGRDDARSANPRKDSLVGSSSLAQQAPQQGSQNAHSPSSIGQGSSAAANRSVNQIPKPPLPREPWQQQQQQQQQLSDFMVPPPQPPHGYGGPSIVYHHPLPPPPLSHQPPFFGSHRDGRGGERDQVDPRDIRDIDRERVSHMVRRPDPRDEVPRRDDIRRNEQNDVWRAEQNRRDREDPRLPSSAAPPLQPDASRRPMNESSGTKRPRPAETPSSISAPPQTAPVLHSQISGLMSNKSGQIAPQPPSAIGRDSELQRRTADADHHAPVATFNKSRAEVSQDVDSNKRRKLGGSEEGSNSSASQNQLQSRPPPSQPPSQSLTRGRDDRGRDEPIRGASSVSLLGTLQPVVGLTRSDRYFQPTSPQQISGINNAPPALIFTQRGDRGDNPPRDARDNLPRDSRDNLLRDARDNPPRDSRDNLSRDSRDNPPRDARDIPVRDSRDNPPRDARDIPVRDARDNQSRDARDNQSRDARGGGSRPPGRDLSRTFRR